MYSVGIQTQSYFTKAFKNEFSKTPSHFIKDFAEPLKLIGVKAVPNSGCSRRTVK